MKEALARIICKDSSNRGVCEKCGFYPDCNKFEVAQRIIDAGYTPVVRCKECKAKHEYIPTRWFCGLTGMPIDENDFCSLGERKNNG